MANKKYNCMENAIHEINREEIKLRSREIYICNRIMHSVIKTIQAKAEEQNRMMKGCDIFYGGSYFCGTKIELPDEYDIDILMKLPTKAQLAAHKREFLTVQLPNFDEKDYDKKYSTLASFLDESNYVIPEKVQDWYMSIVQKSLNKFPGDDNNGFKIKSSYGRVLVKVSRSGPAITLHIQNKQLNIDVDLVPCFGFDISEWKKLYPVQSNGKIKHSDEFFVVPKSPKQKVFKDYRLWKPSFQEEENKMIHNLFHLKPSIKLLKLLRDQLDHKSIKSYYIKTVVMHMLRNEEYPRTFWKCNSLSFVFMTVLKYYSNCLEKGEILSLWTNVNLLEDISKPEKYNISQKIKHIIQELDNCVATNKSEIGNVLKKYFGLKSNEE